MTKSTITYEYEFCEAHVRTRQARMLSLTPDPPWWRALKLFMKLGLLAWAAGSIFSENYQLAAFSLFLAWIIHALPIMEKRRGLKFKANDPRVGIRVRIRLGPSRFRFEFNQWIYSGPWSESFRAHRFDDGIALIAEGRFYWLQDDQITNSTPDATWSLLREKFDGCHDRRKATAEVDSGSALAVDGGQVSPVVAPVRVARSFTQTLTGSTAEVFPLLCPVREADWIDGWDPLLVVSESGLAERDCVFITEASPYDAIWTITRHEPERDFVEMLKVTPEVTVCRLAIQLRATEVGCEAEVTYSHTSLGPAGDAFIDEFTESYFEGFMREWEARLNHYLAHGTALPAG